MGGDGAGQERQRAARRSSGDERLERPAGGAQAVGAVSARHAEAGGLFWGGRLWGLHLLIFN